MRTLLSAAKMPPSMWHEAAKAASYLLNLVPPKVLKGKTPYEVFRGVTPSVSHLRIFGAEAEVKVHSPANNLSPRTESCILLGFCEEQNTYRFWSRENRKIIQSASFDINEDNLTPWKQTPKDDLPMLEESDSEPDSYIEGEEERITKNGQNHPSAQSDELGIRNALQKGAKKKQPTTSPLNRNVLGNQVLEFSPCNTWSSEEVLSMLEKAAEETIRSLNRPTNRL